MTLAHLLQRSLDGVADAIQALVQSHQAAVYRLALTILDDPVEAEEAAQDAFIRALNALETYRGDAQFKSWLFSITINLCRQRLKKRKAKELLLGRLQSLFRLKGEGPAHPEEVLIRREAKTALWKAVEALGEKHRLPLILYYQHELSVAEIAQVLELRPGTVLSRLYTARERLRAALDLETVAVLEGGESESN
jgi:RNA polymerase sigma-70 factor (ECF subfamily)